MSEAEPVEICHTCHRERCGGDACPGPHPDYADAIYPPMQFTTAFLVCNVCGLTGLAALVCANPAARKDAAS